jgi:argininosuccinate lyase
LSAVLRRARLPVQTRKEVVDFISSRDSDRRIARSIVLVNEAHVAALLKAGLISQNDSRKLLQGLRKLEGSYPDGGVNEDFHLYVEQQLTQKLGADVGGKLHTGKSRNDQVATAIRMTLREALLELSNSLLSFSETLVKQAAKHSNTFFVGYTHQQPAQPVTYGHYLLSVADSFLRDAERILECYRRVNASPMGSGALAGSSYEIDRRFVAHLLGFDGLVENSLDGVGSRDFLLESLSVCSLVAADLARVAQDWILYSSADVNLLDLSSEYSSTSSMMPQKKNPDPLEVVRARCATVVGNFSTAATLMHSLPSGYNLDFQELTPPVWTSIDTLQSCFSIMEGAIAHTKLVAGISDRYQVSFTVATELANSLARETRAPFRDAYRWVGQAVRIALKDRRSLKELTRSEWKEITGKSIDETIFQKLLKTADPRSSIGLYRTEGSPSPREVRRMISSRKQTIAQQSRINDRLHGQIQNSIRRLRNIP